MRATLEIDDEVLQAVRALANYKHQGVGKTLSDLARRGLVRNSTPQVELCDGVPVWKHGSGALAVTCKMVRNLTHDE